MIPVSITLRGFRGIKAGIGLDEISLDLSSLPDGIVAICGENGRGKTTILDNLHPYRLMPYKLRKSKDWSPSAFSFYDHCYGPDAMKELVFEMAGVRYKSLLLIDADRKKQEAYLCQDSYSGLPGTERGWVPLNDGKSKTYDEAVERVVGSPTLFFSSVFRAQGAKALSDYTRGDIMGILSELLNIDHIREQGDKCRAVVNELKSRVDMTRSSVSSAQADVDAAVEHDSRISDLKKSVDSAAVEIGRSEIALGQARATISRCEIEQASFDSNTAMRKQLESQRYEEQQRHSGEKQRLLRDRERLAAERIKLDNDAGTKSADLTQRIARAEKITTGAAEIRAAVDGEKLVKSNMDRFKIDLESLEPIHAAEFSKLIELNGRVRELSMAVESITKNVAKLDGIDCRADGSGWINSQCRFVSSAAADRQVLPERVSELEDAQTAASVLKSSVDGYASQIATIKQAIAGCVQELEILGKFSRLAGELEAAEANVTLWRSDLAALECDKQEALTRIGSELDALHTAESDEFHRFSVIECDLLKKIEAIPDASGFFGELERAHADAKKCQLDIDLYQQSVRRWEHEIVALQAKMENVAVKRQVIEAADAEIEKFNALISNFSLLGKACSNDGIIALELDDAAPSIAAIVNDLLMACYGSRFALRLDTQSQKADGGMKESFDIVIYDSETDSERSITECSGGQVNWLEDAITRGISLYNIHRSDRSFGTLFSDEKDGALSPERKLEFFAVKRKAMEIGTHTREFFITQTEDLVSMADARIILAAGKISIP